LARSVGLGPVTSPTRLARTEQLSRTGSGQPRSIPANRACTFASRPVLAQRARQRRRIEPMAWSSAAFRPRQGVPTLGAAQSRHHPGGLGGRCPGPWLGCRPQASTTVATRCKSLKSNPAAPVWRSNTGRPASGAGRPKASKPPDSALLGPSSRAHQGPVLGAKQPYAPGWMDRLLRAHAGRAASLPTFPGADITSSGSAGRDGRKPDLRLRLTVRA
jgi:hypothetical protein